jgi:hypothetical protein
VCTHIQLVQTDEPATPEYFPASQLVQSVEAASPEYLPVEQLLQTVEPAAAAYLPDSVKSSPSCSASAIRAHCSSLAYWSFT